jgi:hypothetical protein
VKCIPCRFCSVWGGCSSQNARHIYVHSRMFLLYMYVYTFMSVCVLYLHLFQHWQNPYPCTQTINIRWRIFIQVVESGHLQNPYHNATHVADVVQSMHCLVRVVYNLLLQGLPYHSGILRLPHSPCIAHVQQFMLLSMFLYTCVSYMCNWCMCTYLRVCFTYTCELLHKYVWSHACVCCQR